MSSCNHSHATAGHNGTRQLALVMSLVFVYLLAEIIGGWWTNSLSLLADAGHMFSDLAALALSLWVSWLKRQPASGQKTYGYHRAEILGALANGALLLLVAGGILRESWDRLQHPHDILGVPMLLIAIGGLAINAISLKILHGSHQHDLNMQGAWLHVLGDTLGSVAVIIAAALVTSFGWEWADPVASMIVCVIIVYSSWNLVKESLGILMEFAPSDLPVSDVESAIREVPGVQDVHCLHIWTIASGLRSISAHVVFATDTDSEQVLEQVHQLLADRFRAQHLTLQVETTDFGPCSTGVCCAIDARPRSADAEHDSHHH